MRSSTDLLTTKDAADLCGVSRDTIKRDLGDGKYPNAIQSGGPKGAWLIPIGDLTAAGRHTPTSDEDALEVVRANLTLVLGAASLVAGTRPTARVLKVELPAAAAATVAFAVAVQGGLTRTEGLLLLLAGLAVAVVVLLRGASDPDDLDVLEAPTVPARGPLVWTVAGLAGVLAGAQALVWGAQTIAAAVGLGEGLVGLTLVAVGTSAPELATGVSAARRGHHELLIGNVLGSNLLNSLAVGGVAALVGPGLLDAPAITVVATGVMLAVTAVTAAVLVVRRRVGRGTGVVLIAAWVATVPLVA